MDESVPWVLVTVCIILALLGVFVFFIFRNKKKQPDFYSLYIAGILWLLIGIPFKNYILFFLGLIFALAGMVNKDKWKKNRQVLSELNQEQKIIWFITLLVLSFLVFAGFLIYLLSSSGMI